MRKRIYVPVFLAAVALVMVLNAGLSSARIKLTTLPARERVEIQLDNGNFTLVEEERIVPLLKSGPETGNNMIDFSWSNTQINKDTILFRPLAVREGEKFVPIKKVKAGDKEVDEINVINVSYPPNENALVWEVYSAKACAVKVRVSYLISNLQRGFHYKALANKDESLMTLRKFIKLSNYSGEEFGSSNVWAGFGPQFHKEIGMEEDVQMLVEKFAEVPVTKQFTFDWYAHGALNPDKPFASKILMHYKLMNDDKNKLGKFPLQPGKARIFVEDGHGGEAFLGEDWAPFTPLGGEMKLYLGEAHDIVCTRKVESNKRHEIRGNLFNQEITVKYEIENFKDKDCTLRIIEQLNRICMEYGGRLVGDVEWEKGEKTSKEINVTIEEGGNSNPVLNIKLPARPKEKDKAVQKQTLIFHFTLKNVWN